ncbi:PREDICTED: acyl-coenzyme A thioesterase THEM4 [Chrysochloris asiatica]|uniref:Acyl-coenzyme A thioesterase THEM4 n=1 Tax=Chrysochloris asiatica TaxID=185453 RepID=A0A9B0TJU7_CHRAS|nr:PREDICTED: acyl-coenzyme A thioesterase THEM4 [Chrysochloris asiatica]
MLRSCAVRLRTLRVLRDPPGVARPWRSFSSEEVTLEDQALPKPSWNKDIRFLFDQFMKKCEDGSWERLMSTKEDLISQARLFTRSFEDGMGFEYVMFYNEDEKRMVCLFQGGPYLQGAPGFAHGGSLAAMMDETFSKTAYLAGEGLFTLSLNLRFKNLIPVGSLAVLNVEVEKIEDQKIYISCTAQSRDQQTIYAKSSAVFLQLQLEEDSSL